MLTNSLICSLMPSAKRNLTMDVAIYRLDFFTVQHCFISRCAFLPTTGCTMHASWTYLCSPCVPVLFTDKGICQFVIARYGFPQAVREFHSYFLYQVYPSFLYCSSFVRLCNKRSIVKNEVQQTTSLSARNLLIIGAFRC